ncbi:hypothetical protein B0H14DRAFT_2649188 [Mycena olivaceomarginata]|nr:hypothetical protein B0H14DRAFT_2649188 [Mycena olivaceomarginata]
MTQPSRRLKQFQISFLRDGYGTGTVTGTVPGTGSAGRQKQGRNSSGYVQCFFWSNACIRVAWVVDEPMASVSITEWRRDTSKPAHPFPPPPPNRNAPAPHDSPELGSAPLSTSAASTPKFESNPPGLPSKSSSALATANAPNSTPELRTPCGKDIALGGRNARVEEVALDLLFVAISIAISESAVMRANEGRGEKKDGRASREGEEESTGKEEGRTRKEDGERIRREEETGIGDRDIGRGGEREREKMRTSHRLIRRGPTPTPGRAAARPTATRPSVLAPSSHTPVHRGLLRLRRLPPADVPERLGRGRGGGGQVQERRGDPFMRRRWELPTPGESLELGRGYAARATLMVRFHGGVRVALGGGGSRAGAPRDVGALTSLSCVGPASSAARARRSSVLFLRPGAWYASRRPLRRLPPGPKQGDEDEHAAPRPCPRAPSRKRLNPHSAMCFGTLLHPGGEPSSSTATFCAPFPVATLEHEELPVAPNPQSTSLLELFSDWQRGSQVPSPTRTNTSVYSPPMVPRFDRFIAEGICLPGTKDTIEPIHVAPALGLGLSGPLPFAAGTRHSIDQRASNGPGQVAKHHIVAILHPEWGHTIGYIYVAVQMFNKDPTLVVMILQHNIIVSQMKAELATLSHSDQTVLRKAFESSPVVGWKPSLTSFREAMLNFSCGGLVIEETKKTLGRYFPMTISGTGGPWTISCYRLQGFKKIRILSEDFQPLQSGRDTKLAMLSLHTDFASTNPFNLDTYSCLWLETVDGHPDLPPSALNPLNAPRGVSGIKTKIGRPSTLFQKRSRDRCSSEASLTGTAAERYGSALKTNLNLPLLGSKSARSISNSSQIPTPNGTTHSTTNDGGLFRSVHGAPRWGLGLRLRAAVFRAHLPLHRPGVQADFPDYVRCRWPWAQGVPVADNPHRTIHSLCPEFGYFFFHICMDSRLAIGASTAQATKMATLDLRKCFSISFFVYVWIPGWPRAHRPPKRLGCKHWIRGSAELKQKPSESRPDSVVLKQTIPMALKGPFQLYKFQHLGRNIADIQSPGFTNVKVDSSSVALGDLAGVMDARRPQPSKLESSLTAPCIYLAGFGIAAAPFKLKFLAIGVASRSLGQWTDQYYGSRPKPESLEQDAYLGCISRWRGDDYPDGMEAETWKGPEESVATWLYREFELGSSR